MLCDRCHAEVRVPRTERQRQILDYYRAFVSRRGYAPSYTQIARFFKLKSKATIWKHMMSLRRQGFLVEADAAHS